MKPSFWIKRFCLIFTGVFALLFALYVIRGRAPGVAAQKAVLWAAISTSLFIATRLYRSRQGQHCELCGDTPETAGKVQCSLPKTSAKPR